MLHTGRKSEYEGRETHPVEQQEFSLSEAHDAMFKGYPDAVTVKELCTMFGGIGERETYRLLRSRTIAGVRSGRGYKIPKINVIKYLLSI